MPCLQVGYCVLLVQSISADPLNIKTVVVFVELPIDRNYLRDSFLSLVFKFCSNE